ncbi:MAG: DUF2778 domain-containing protein [Deltaproteobacteria bacterium]|nr:DUF2778 domain-containing protein [Deltaproteobacteria bacterium]
MEAFTYDAVGNRLTAPAYPKASAYSQNYSYDYDNGLVSVTKQIVGNPNADTILFKYDPFGRRIEKSIYTYENGTPTTYKYTYVYDNEDIILEIQEKTQNGNTITTTTAYTHGPGIDEPLSMERGGNRYYYHADGLGSITSMTDSTEAVVNRYAYDPFGAIDKSESIRNAYTYTGREYDSETGLYYYRARYYDPQAGRFVSKDPIGFESEDVNVYEYVDSNPLISSDPLGLAKCVYSISNHTLSCKSNAGGEVKVLGPNGVFSGAPICRNKPSCANVKDLGPISPGDYNINRDYRPGKEKQWRLKSTSVSSWKCYLGLARCGFNLHLGTRSAGCITADINNTDTVKQYDQLHKLLLSEEGSNTMTVLP